MINSATVTLSPEQLELNAFIAAENAAFDAKCRAEGAMAWGLFALTAVDLAKYGVYNVAQLKEWRQENERLEAAKDARSWGY